MPEYFNVEKPFLDKLRRLAWQAIVQGILPYSWFVKWKKKVVLQEASKT